MNKRLNSVIITCFLLVSLGWLLSACSDDGAEGTPEVSPTQTTAVQPTPLQTEEVTQTIDFPANPDFITVATDAPYLPFASIDEFGTVTGLDADIMRLIGEEAELETEFVVTPYEGMLSSVSSGEFDTAMSGLVIPETPPEGIRFTIPYLEVGQLMMVRANESRFASHLDMPPDVRLGVIQNSAGAQTVEDQLGIPASDLLLFEGPPQAVQALIDGNVDAIILGSDDAAYYAAEYFQQVRIAGGEGREPWISRVGYGIAVAAGNDALLTALNDAIAALQDAGALAEAADAWLVEIADIEAGDSLIGTAANELVIGMNQPLQGLDPAGVPDLVAWEINRHTMSGLYRINDLNELEASYAAGMLVSEGGLVYTIQLRSDINFPDGTPITSDDVRWSIMRSAGLGNWLVNSFLKDEDDSGFADEDAVVVVAADAVQITLDQPVAYFPSLLATPPYAILNEECYALEFDPTSVCGGNGPYVIDSWDQGETLVLQANPNWMEAMPVFSNIQIRFYDTTEGLLAALARGSIDLAWTGTVDTTMVPMFGESNYEVWHGPGAFSSSLVFVHDIDPWDDVRVRQAAALALDRQAIVEQVFPEARQPLLGPVPESVPGSLALEPERDLDRARVLLQQAGYSEAQPAVASLWYVNDGRYSSVEAEYANAIKNQLEETGLFQVMVEGAPWEIFRNQKSACAYGAFLQGWPTPGQPVPYMDPMSWLYFYLESTDRLCSNYESEAMAALLEELDASEPADFAVRAAVYQRIQELWLEELPSLPLTQAPRLVIAQPGVEGVVIDAMGLLHYEGLSKQQAEE